MLNVSKKGSFRSLFCLYLWLSTHVALGSDCHLTNEQQQSLPVVTIAKVYDGDTVELADGRKVRFIGINTPEVQREDRPAEPVADQAKHSLMPWQGKKAYLLVGEEDKDRYGRVLGHLFALDGSNITAKLLAEGAGFTVAIPPNDDYLACYRRSATIARQANRGVWASSYHRVRTTSLAADLKGGFGRYRGKIERIYVSKKVIWVDMFGDISLRIARKDQFYLKGEVLSRLLKAVDEGTVLKLPQLEFTGWLVDRTNWGKKMVKKIQSGKRKRWQMNIRHRNHWRLSNL